MGVTIGVTVGMWVESCSPLAYAHVDSLIKQSRHHLKVNQAIKRCTKARSSDQDRILVIKNFDRRHRWKYRAHCGDYPLCCWVWPRDEASSYALYYWEVSQVITTVPPPLFSVTYDDNSFVALSLLVSLGQV